MKFINKVFIANKEVSSMDYVELFLRWVLAYILIVNSRIGVTVPLESLGMPSEIFQIFDSMWKTNFIMHLVKLVELLAGIALIFNFYLPVFLIALVPVVINIYGIHIFLFNNIFSQGLLMLLITIFLVFRRRELFIYLVKRT